MEVLSTGLFWLCCIFATLSFILLLLVRHQNTPRWLDVLTGVILIATSALFLGIFLDVQALIPSMVDNSSDASHLNSQYTVAILIIPFISAAIGTNLISHAITYNHDYKNTKTLESIGTDLKGILKWIFLMTPPIIIFTGLHYLVNRSKHNK
ncbi:hypothetical protein [Paraglaciecola sp.]|uniref:hypothetical protein n=1 Tax=Paraglaciecola sp. TaxID=1920173 RepID=UPI0032666236